MEHRYSDKLRKVMQEANSLAIKYGHDLVGPEHILRAILLQSDDKAVAALRVCGIDHILIIKRIDELLIKNEDVLLMGKLARTSAAIAMMQCATNEAARLQNDYIGTEHVLLALCDEQEGIASNVLREFEITKEKISAALSAL